MAKKKTDIKYYEAVGRRKSSLARVRLYIATTDKEKVKKGEIMVNNLPAVEYFPGKAHQALFTQPLDMIEARDRFAISILTRGGGKHGQMEASILGIARALELVDVENRATLKPEGLLSRDARVRERRKAGTGGRARRQKQSPKR